MQYQTLDTMNQCRTFLIKGAPGSGKTWKAAHFPNPVYFNFDHNLRGISKLPAEIRDNIRILDPAVKYGADGSKTKLKGRMVWANFIDQLKQVFEDESVETIIVDSVTTAQEYLMDKILGSESPDSQMQLQHWGAVQRYWKALAEEVLCNEMLDKHVIFIAHERPYEDSSTGAKVTKYGLNMSGSTKDSFGVYFTDEWRCFVDISTKGATYKVATAPRNTFDAKCSMELPPVFEWEKELPNILKQL